MSSSDKLILDYTQAVIEELSRLPRAVTISGKAIVSKIYQQAQVTQDVIKHKVQHHYSKVSEVESIRQAVKLAETHYDRSEQDEIIDSLLVSARIALLASIQMNLQSFKLYCLDNYEAIIKADVRHQALVN